MISLMHISPRANGKAPTTKGRRETWSTRLQPNFHLAFHRTHARHETIFRLQGGPQGELTPPNLRYMYGERYIYIYMYTYTTCVHTYISTLKQDDRHEPEVDAYENSERIHANKHVHNISHV